MAFEQFIGNDSAKEFLRSVLSSGHIGHAYIFQGQRGSGRMTLAKEFAGELLGTDKPETHPDFSVVTNRLYDPSKKQDNVLIDTVRSMKRDVYIKPYADGRKVYIIPMADTMQAPAQNSLLKVFEEPPEYCTIILLAENASLFLPTILSRAALLQLYPAGREQTKEYLIRKNIDEEKSAKLAAISGGVIGRAEELLGNDDIIKLRDEVFDVFIAFAEGSYRNMYNFIKFLKRKKSDIDFILETLLGCGRDLMSIKLGGLEIVNADKEAELRRISGKLTRESALRLNETTVKYQSIINGNGNYPAAVLCMAAEYWEEIHDRDSRS